MGRKPNYGFERKERERAKAARTAERVKAKASNPMPSAATAGQADDQGSEHSPALGLPKQRDDPAGVD